MGRMLQIGSFDTYSTPLLAYLPVLYSLETQRAPFQGSLAARAILVLWALPTRFCWLRLGVCGSEVQKRQQRHLFSCSYWSGLWYHSCWAGGWQQRREFLHEILVMWLGTSVTTYYPVVKYFLLKQARLHSLWTRTLINAEVFKFMKGYYPSISLTLGVPAVLESWLEAMHSFNIRKLDWKAHFKFKILWFLSSRTRTEQRGETSYVCLSQFFNRVYLFLRWVSHLTKSTAFLGDNVSGKKVTDTVLRNNKPT